jgi:hypothetical protein
MSNNTFLPTSRYYGLGTVEITLPEGANVTYVERRFVPPRAHFATLREHLVKMGERPDSIAAEELNDSEQFWRICDANGVMRPDDLVAEPGRRVRITLPVGIPGPPRA